MLFLLAKIFGLLANPGEILLLLSGIGTALCAFGRQKWGLLALYAGVGGFLLIAVLPIDRWMIGPLEARFPRVITPPARVDGIIVLGGAVDTARTAEHGIPALNWAAERMTAFVGLTRRYPEAKLIFTGGSGELRANGRMETAVARALFTELGVKPERMIYEDASRTTYENAEFSRRLMAPKPREIWLLVTSANHMPRAVGVFRHVGWKILPWPVAFKTPPTEDFFSFSPLAGHLAVVDLAFHEWLGLLVYYLTGRSDELFPGPE